ncbi:MAG: CapA family protein [Bacillota bacterium]
MKFAILGDFILSNKFSIDNSLADILKENDFNIVNLEAPFIPENMKNAQNYGLYHHVDDCSILKNLNVEYVSLANNHMNDFGIHGIENTLKVLSNNGIKYFGIGKNNKEALKPIIIETQNFKISVYGFLWPFIGGKIAGKSSYGSPSIEVGNFRDIEDDSDLKIAYIHWNQEFEYYPEPYSKHIAYLLSNKFDIIAGSHSHCIQGIEKRNNSEIFYSLGNFSVPHIEYSGKILKSYPKYSYESFFPVFEKSDNLTYNIIPFQISNDGCVLSKLGEKDNFFTRLNNISEPLKLCYKKYRKFYVKNKKRKLKFTTTRSHFINRLLFFLSYHLNKMVQFAEKRLNALLKSLGIKDFIKRKFFKIINKINSIR